MAISMIGLGALGSTIAGQFVECGHSVTVWNRTAAKMDALVSAGAQRADTAARAFEQNDLTVLCLNDGNSVTDLLQQEEVAEAVRGKGLVNLTTFSGDEAAQFAQWSAEHGVRYLQGGVNAYPRDIGKADTSILYGGDEELFAEYEDTLRCLAGGQLYVGPDPSGVAMLYTALWSYYFSAVAGFYEAAALAGEAGVGFDQLLDTVQTVMLPQIVGSLRDTAKRLETGDFGPDQGRLVNTANTMEDYAAVYDGVGLRGRFIHATHAYLKSAVEAGDGDKNLGALLATVRTKATVAGN